MNAKEQAFRDRITRFISEHSPYIRCIAARMAPYPALADDLAQETFLIACRKWKTFDEEREIKHWLAGICRNLCREAWRKEIKKGKIQRDGLAEYVEQLAVETDEHFTNMRKAALQECLDKLPQRSRTMLDLKYQMALKAETIARNIHTSAEAVRMSLVRIRQQLRNCIMRVEEQFST